MPENTQENTAGINLPGVNSDGNTNEIGNAIASVLSGFTARIDRETRASAPYAQILNSPTRADMYRLVWDDYRNYTIAIGTRTAVVKGLPLRHRALTHLFAIHAEMHDLRTVNRMDALGGSTDRAYQTYAKAVDEAFRDESSPIVEIPADAAESARNVFVYEHLEGRTMSLLRYLDMTPPAATALWAFSADMWGRDKSDRTSYRLWREFPHAVFAGAAEFLNPTDAEIGLAAAPIFGPTPDHTLNKDTK